MSPLHIINIPFILLELGPIKGSKSDLHRPTDCNPLVLGYEVRYKSTKGP